MRGSKLHSFVVYLCILSSVVDASTGHGYSKFTLSRGAHSTQSCLPVITRNAALIRHEIPRNVCPFYAKRFTKCRALH
eukprot:8472409-Pyramimonas_sp.AAC.1